MVNRSCHQMLLNPKTFNPIYMAQTSSSNEVMAWSCHQRGSWSWEWHGHDKCDQLWHCPWKWRPWDGGMIMDDQGHWNDMDMAIVISNGIVHGNSDFRVRFSNEYRA
ncbi:hypothetical protein AMTR_s00031p00087920 [Amborella trichopoda]|uniref:Uncharacterized protein n=1 Tax=Amborella trichopoda TaxID=13333 RepID=U5D830_AMBTC|nr:hypothetical protein AMTR_s00031p00087920 [Amborella trichopoda]